MIYDKFNIKTEQNYSLATISDNIAITRAYITVDLHENNSVSDQANFFIYPEIMLAGAGQRNRVEFINTLRELGAEIDIFVSDNKLTFKLTSLSDKFSSLIDLFTDMVEAPAFNGKELERIKYNIVNKLELLKEDSKFVAATAFKNAIYPVNSRYNHAPLNKLAATVSRIGFKDLSDLHERLLDKYWRVTVVGPRKNIKVLSHTLESLRKNRTDIQGGKNDNEVKSDFKKINTKPRLLLHSIPGKQNIDFVIGAPLPIDFYHEDYMPISFALAVLGKWGGFAGRLMSTVREKEGLTYGIYSRLDGFYRHEFGYWQVVTFFSPEKVVNGLKSTFREVKKISTRGITGNELEKFKTIMRTGETLLQDSPLSQVANFHFFHQQDFSVEDIKKRIDKINEFDVKTVNNVIKKYLNHESLFVSGAGPIKGPQQEINLFFDNLLNFDKL